MSLLSKGEDQDHDIEGYEQDRRKYSTNNTHDLLLQVRAFLKAAEDVDLDAETAEDLIQSFPSDLTAEFASTDDDDDDEDEDTDTLYEIEEQGTPEMYLVLLNLSWCRPKHLDSARNQGDDASFKRTRSELCHSLCGDSLLTRLNRNGFLGW